MINVVQFRIHQRWSTELIKLVLPRLVLMQAKCNITVVFTVLTFNTSMLTLNNNSNGFSHERICV